MVSQVPHYEAAHRRALLSKWPLAERAVQTMQASRLESQVSRGAIMNNYGYGFAYFTWRKLRYRGVYDETHGGSLVEDCRKVDYIYFGVMQPYDCRVK